MPPWIKDKIIFDIGCGSGILSIAAVLLGAKKAYGIDIEEKAITHSQENVKINHVEEKTHFSQILDLSWIADQPCVILMNMIETEQQIAWKALAPLHAIKAHLITSGILTIQKNSYLKLVTSWGWTLEEEKDEGDWSAFVFVQNDTIQIQ
jgi:ribosomal protein L11 methyltransferase